jgi:ketosteroid isomerase-like protein
MKGKVAWVFLVVLLGILISSCKTPGTTGLSDQDRAAILKVSEDGIKFMNPPIRDFEAGVTFYYTEDAMTLPPNEPVVQGRASQIAWYKANPPFELAEKIVELDGRGDLAYARVTYTLKVRVPGAKEPIVDTGKGMEIWKKQKDGSWKCSCDVFNSDLPMATPSEPAKTTEVMLSDLRGVHNAWFEGLLAEDTKILNKVLSDEVTLGFPGGNAMPRAEFLSLLQSGELFYDTAEHESVGFRVYGNTAVATGRSNLTYRYKGTKDFERLSYTAVYAKTNGEWKMVAWQSTRRPK